MRDKQLAVAIKGFAQLDQLLLNANTHFPDICCTRENETAFEHHIAVRRSKDT
jgi:hypothetical protein